jgi:hypothetical protein
MNHLANKAAEMALRLAAVPAGRQPDTADLDALEQLAMDVLQQVSAARLDDNAYAVGEIRGYWPAYVPGRQ